MTQVSRVRLIEDSIHPDGEQRISTFVLQMPKFLLAQLNTHRVLSKNALSSRAVPPERMIEQVRSNPFIPISFGKSQKGMQPTRAEEEEEKTFTMLWQDAIDSAVDMATYMAESGMSKQYANRPLEFCAHASVIVTAVDWDNFFKLRCNQEAQVDFARIAVKMRDLLNNQTPKKQHYHLPFVTQEERSVYPYEQCANASAARCARVSYNRLQGGNPDFKTDLQRALTLRSDGHLSPFEHQARSDTLDQSTIENIKRLNRELPRGVNLIVASGNFHATTRHLWVQNRHY